MKYDPEKHHRRSIRMKGFDYRQNAAYFVTIDAHDGAAAQNDSTADPRAGTSPASTMPPGLGDVIGAFKSISTHEIILAVRRGDLPSFAGKIWQRNYYERIIRDDQEWERIAHNMSL